ncbi:MAG TPA: TetR/AcrR family transcriptional regulator [Vicinamibacterales bacterium]|jgi:AcrR family transcriptional regulator|nr:TetR/AcrR family transcriptional regulator [Vicinamibacterales bacterium]
MPSARPSKQDVLGAFRRSALLESARRVFGRAGFENATMEAIAKDADVAKGTVYLYYPSKRAIYDAAIEGCMAELEGLTRARVEAAGSLREAIATLVATRLEFFQRQQDFFRMYIAEIGRSLTQTRGARSRYVTRLDRQTQILQRAIARAVGRGEVRAVDPAATAQAVFDMTRGFVARHLLEQGRQDPARDVEFLTNLIWTGLGPARGKQTR